MTKLIKIYAMSTSKSEVIEKVKNRSHSFYKHCIKIMANPDYTTVGFWAKEIWGMCEWLQDIIFTHNKKSVDKTFVKKYLFEYGLDNKYVFSRSLDRAYIDKYSERDNSKDDLLFNNYKMFCEEIANHIDSKTLTKECVGELVEKYLII